MDLRPDLPRLGHVGEDRGGAGHDGFVSATVRDLPIDMMNAQAKGQLADLPDLRALGVAAVLADQALMRTGLRRVYGWSEEDLAMFTLAGSKVTGAKVKYLRSDAERRPYEAVTGPSITRSDGTPLDTRGNHSKFLGAGFAIYAMDGNGRLYVGQHAVGLFHHSSFMAGGNVAGAGELLVREGRLIAISNKSGHYQPRTEHLQRVLQQLHGKGVSMEGVTAICMLSAQVNCSVAADELRTLGERSPAVVARRREMAAA